jgi:hypothetical protein
MERPSLMRKNPTVEVIKINSFPLDEGAKGILNIIEKTISGKTNKDIVFDLELEGIPVILWAVIASNLVLWDDVRSLEIDGCRIFPRDF